MAGWLRAGLSDSAYLGANLRHTDKRLQQSGPAPPRRASPRIHGLDQSQGAPGETTTRFERRLINIQQGSGARRVFRYAHSEERHTEGAGRQEKYRPLGSGREAELPL